VSARLTELLSNHPRSLAQLSEESGLGESTIGRLARGESEPTLSEMVALAAVFDLASIEELIAPNAPSRTKRLITAAESDSDDAGTG
jgi:transcriptional regulator with XRE-family HTH domain